MRYTTTLILAILAIGVAVVIVVFWDRLTGEKPDKPEEEGGEQALVQDAAVEDVLTVAVLERGEDGEFVERLALEQTDGKWRLLEPVSALADEYQARQLARAAVEARYRQARDLTGPGAADPASLGLSEPRYRVTVGLKATDEKEARTVTIDVGKATPFGNRLYVRLDEGNKAQVLNSDDLLERVSKPVAEYRSRELVDLVRDDLVRIDLEGPQGKVRLERSEEDKDRWLLVEPLTARADPEATDELVRETLNLRIKEFIADGVEDLSRYGLAGPRLRIALWKKGTPPEKEKADEAADDEGDGDDAEQAAPAPPPPEVAVTLKFGSFADMKRETVHVMTGDDRSIVSVDADKLQELDRSAKDLRDKHVLALDTGRVKSIEVRNASGAFELAKKDGRWHLEPPDRAEMKADKGAVDSLLDELKGLEVVYFDEDADPDETVPADSPGVRLRLEGEAAPRGFRLALDEKAGSRVRNVREDWVGRINEEELDWYTKGWLAYPSKDVLELEPDDVETVTVTTPDRTVEVGRAGEDQWSMKRPVEADAEAQAVKDLLNELVFLRPERFVAAADDFGEYGLGPGQVVCTVTEKAEEEGAEPAVHTLHLTVRPDGEIVGRVSGSDLVFEVAERVLHEVAGELLPKKLTDFSSWDVEEMLVAAGNRQQAFVKKDGDWYRRDAGGARGEKVEGDAARDLASACAGLEVVRWADYEAEKPGKFGLDKPALEVTVGTDEGDTTLLVSGKEVDPAVRRLFDRTPARYAMVEGGERIGILAGADLETILSAPRKLAITPQEAEGPGGEEKADDEGTAGQEDN